LSAELVPGAMISRTVLDQPIVLFRAEHGPAAALENRCPHRNVSLSMGRVVGEQLQCGYHGLRFDARGRCVHIPGNDRSPLGIFAARSYPLTERYGYLWIWMGDPQRADPSAVPDYSWQTDPNWTGELRLRSTRCNYRLALENVLDLSHASYVHGNTVG